MHASSNIWIECCSTSISFDLQSKQNLVSLDIQIFLSIAGEGAIHRNLFLVKKIYTVNLQNFKCIFSHNDPE
jgi:hypothetical protein